MTAFVSHACLLALTIVPVLAQNRPRPALDYAFFKDRVQPILLDKRPGHARCVTCHQHGSPPLEPLAAGAAIWNEEQSRKNFAIWKMFAVPGQPEKSPLLLHPLAREAGGDRFHAGGKHWKSRSDPEWQTLAGWVRGQTMGANRAAAVRVLQTNAAGDNVHVIDPATNRVVGIIEDIEVPHGITIAPDGTRIYITDEALRTLDVVDAKTLKVFQRIPLSGRPNNVDVSRDGSKVYVGIRQAPGAVDVIDAKSFKNVKSVPVKGEIHNVYVTPDGKYAVAGSIAASAISVIDTSTDALAWTLTLDAGIRPMAFTRNKDGSTKEIIVQLSNFHGFVVVDFAARKEVRRITLPDVPGHEKETQGLQGSPSHGLAITPDGKMLWATSKYYDSVAAYSLPDYQLLKVIPVGLHPEWLTIPPDGRQLYVAIAGDDATAVVDIRKMELVKKIPVGAVPKRNASGTLLTASSN
ncbi:MAG: beta-propeller fold lactonase family protein [Bryobacterales bacterium]|nr:beta-propeller fold lactonase family protein [Bryobacterales bacterium]